MNIKINLKYGNIGLILWIEILINFFRKYNGVNSNCIHIFKVVWFWHWIRE